MLEKLVLLVNNVRIIYNLLQPKRRALGIKEAAKKIALQLIAPWLEEKRSIASRAQAAKKRKNDEKKEPIASAADKKRRQSWSSAKTAWTSEMADALEHFPVRAEGGVHAQDPRRNCLQCSRAGKKTFKTFWFCPGCTYLGKRNANGEAVRVWLCFGDQCKRDCFREWHKQHTHNTRS